MPHDDSLFEKALARQLGNTREADGKLTSGAGATGQYGGCLDAEVLAAYHEGSLSKTEMNLYEEHVASCPRCQELLSLLETTDAIPGGTSDVDLAALTASKAGGLPAVSRRAQPRDTSPAISFGARWRRHYWIAPLGAVAAALVGWAVIHHQDSGRVAQKGQQEIASNRVYTPTPETPKLEMPKLETQTPAPVSDFKKEAGAEPKVATNLRGNVLTKDKEVSSQRETLILPKDAPTPSTRPLMPGPTAPAVPRPQPPAPAATVGGSSVGIGGGTGGGTGPGATTQTVEVISETPLVATDSSQAVLGGAKAAQAAPASESGQVTITSERHLPVNGHDYTQLLDLVPDPHLISVPGADILWRVGSAGKIEKSLDASAHWKREKSHVKVDLTTGSAPSAEICWIVGASGTILRTQDGGAYWKKVSSPLQGEIGGVRAVDAEHAIVWNGDKSSSFATADGGATWSPVPNQ